MTVDELVAAVGGKRLGAPSAGWQPQGVCTDSRTVAPGEIFVALRGAHFDGNDYIDDAIARSAGAVVCSRGRALDRRGVLFVETDDTQRALGDIAAHHRRGFPIPVVGITGSNGKTTTKELLRSICHVAYGAEAVLANSGNFNNLIGLPLTVMGLHAGHRVAILEMGMNAPGEIARLTEIAAPTHGVITCIAAAHLQGLGSLDGVAAAKAELFAGLGPAATAIVNTDDERVVRAALSFKGARRVRYGECAEIRAESVASNSLTGSRFDLVYGTACVSVLLPLAGRHNVGNAVAAAACAYGLELPIEAVAAGLTDVAVPPMRIGVETLGNGVCIVNDAYNANPGSLAAALRTLAEAVTGRRILAIGDMLELGDRAAELHREAGRAAAALTPVLLCAVGEHAREVAAGAREAGLAQSNILVASDHARIVHAIAGIWQAGDTVLVKGSRGAQMERVVVALRELVAS